jgi:hypothetical protein
LNPNDVDIFGYDEGGPVGQMKRRRDPDRDSDPLITPAQIAYYASQFAPGTGIYDASGRMAAPPSDEAGVIDAFSGEYMPSIGENIAEGEYFDAAMQGLGVLGDAMYAVPLVGPVTGVTLGSTFKGIGQAGKGIKKGIESLGSQDLDRIVRAKDQGFDVDQVYYHGSGADITEFRMPTRETGQTKTAGTGVFFSNSPRVAETYTKTGEVMYPVFLNKKEYLKIKPSSEGQLWSNIEVDDLRIEYPDGTSDLAVDVFDDLDPMTMTDTDQLSFLARKQGFKGLVIEGVRDIGMNQVGRFRDMTKYLADRGYDSRLPTRGTEEDYSINEKIPADVLRDAKAYSDSLAEQNSDIVVSFDPSTIRSVNAEFAEGTEKSADILGRGIGSLADQGRDDDLQFLMNIGVEGLEKQERMGGFPMPSLAVTRQDLPFDSFGDITMVGKPESFDPKGSRTNIVYDADAYTTRAPQPFRIAKKDSDIAFAKKYKSLADKYNETVDGELYELAQQETKKYATPSRFNDVKYFFEGDILADVAFLKEKGIDDIPVEIFYGKERIDSSAVRKKLEPFKDERRAWAQSQIDELFKPEEIFDASNTRDFVTGKGLIFKPYTADEVTKYMKKSRGRAQESGLGSIGPGSLRASLTKRLRNLKEIKDKSGNIVGKDDFEVFKNQSYKDVQDLSETLKPFYKFDSDRFGYPDEVIDMLVESERVGLDRAAKEFGFEDLEDYVYDDVSDLKSKFERAPTEYFEAKPERVVKLEEFEGAIVPEDTPQAMIDKLENKGIKVEKYKDSEERLKARRKFKGTSFSAAGGIILVGAVGNQSVKEAKKEPEKLYQGGAVSMLTPPGMLKSLDQVDIFTNSLMRS